MIPKWLLLGVVSGLTLLSVTLLALVVYDFIANSGLSTGFMGG